MNELLNDSLAFDRHSSDIKRAEINYTRQVALAGQGRGARFRIAVALLNLATRIQPALAVQLQQPVEPLAA